MGLVGQLAEWLWQAMWAGVVIVLALHFLNGPEPAVRDSATIPADSGLRPERSTDDARPRGTLHAKPGGAIGCLDPDALVTVTIVPSWARDVRRWNELMDAGGCFPTIDTVDWQPVAMTRGAEILRLCITPEGRRICMFFRAEDMIFVP